MGQKSPIDPGMPADELGKRDRSAHEAESLEALLDRARSLGFSPTEIEKIRKTYRRAGSDWLR